MEEIGKNPIKPTAAAPLNEPLGVNGAPLREQVTTAATAVPNNQITNAAPATRPVAPPKGKDKDKPAPPEPKDGTREVIDTIVIVVVLVLLLKTFLAEAFVIPTGSMATTLLGYHKQITCPACGHEFEVNLSKQVDAAEEHPQPIVGCTCPNCRLHIELVPPEQWMPQRNKAAPEQ